MLKNFRLCLYRFRENAGKRLSEKSIFSPGEFFPKQRIILVGVLVVLKNDFIPLLSLNVFKEMLEKLMQSETSPHSTEKISKIKLE